MNETKTIEIDIELYRIIEGSRADFSETQNDILKRLCGVVKRDLGVVSSPGKPWKRSGVLLPHGTQVRAQYNGVTYSGVIDEGDWLVNNKRFFSPSGALHEVTKTKEGNKTSLNGWMYWEAKLPNTSRWVSINELRDAL